MLSLVIPPPPANRFHVRKFKTRPKHNDQPRIGYISDGFMNMLSVTDVIDNLSVGQTILHRHAKGVLPIMDRRDVFTSPVQDMVDPWQIYCTLMQQPTPQDTGFLRVDGANEFYIGHNVCVLVYPFYQEGSTKPEGWGITTRPRDTGADYQMRITGTKCAILPHPNYHDRVAAFKASHKSEILHIGGDIGSGL